MQEAAASHQPAFRVASGTRKHYFAFGAGKDCREIALVRRSDWKWIKLGRWNDVVR
jgi:hypothetical protein